MDLNTNDHTLMVAENHPQLSPSTTATTSKSTTRTGCTRSNIKNGVQGSPSNGATTTRPLLNSTKTAAGEAVTRELMARLGLNETTTKSIVRSAKKKRIVEKIMVAELHHMQGELAQQQASLRNENDALKQMIEQLRLQKQQQLQVSQAAASSSAVTTTDS